MYALQRLRCLLLYCALVLLARSPAVQATNLLTSYLPASMQALAYYIDYLQYEPISTTTVEPPFSVSDDVLADPPSTASTTPASTTPAITTTTTTTARPTSSSYGSTVSSSGSTTTTSWWQPPSWWQTPTTATTASPPSVKPTSPHKPAVYAPQQAKRFKQQQQQQPNRELFEGYALFNSIGNNPEGFDKLPLSLIRDIKSETPHDDFNNDVESLDNFLRLYDDNYGRAAFDPDNAMDRWSSTSTAGKKRIPPTKPYVEFLLVYDLLKRDAKAANLSKYEGYSEELLRELHALSHVSAVRQLHTIFKRMLDRGDVQRSDVVSRIQSILKDLGNPSSVTSRALQFIPALVFLP